MLPHRLYQKRYMSAFNDIHGRLQEAERRLLANLQRIAVTGANDLSSLISLRVVNNKQTVSGGNFTPYSKTPVPAWFYRGKSRTSSADTAVSALAKKGEKLSYSGFRELNNLDGSNKNFEFTGEMWRAVGVVGSTVSGPVAAAYIGANTKAGQDKLKWTSTQEGRSVIEASGEELDAVGQVIGELIENTLKG